MKLWQKESTNTSELIEQFTVGRDREFDLLLAPFDVQGSLAHVAMLERVGLLPANEYVLIKKELEAIHKDIETGNFILSADAEDIHSQIEQRLSA